MSPSPACMNGTCGGTCGRRESIGQRHCDSPGCTRGQGSFYGTPSNTQDKKRPKKNPHSVAATLDESYSEVVWAIESANHVLAIVLYPAVAKFNGLKLAVYAADTWQKLKAKLNKLDPHFYDDGDSPVARFVPTRAGLNMAYALLEINADVQQHHNAIVDQLLAYRNRALK